MSPHQLITNFSVVTDNGAAIATQSHVKSSFYMNEAIIFYLSLPLVSTILKALLHPVQFVF